ncbi:cytochrome P450 [Cladorrhinum samala]|uniref:Cytochrome P450 n=1 Tax=Cladorrhinum samala TaxID=585594 RepID=A0AAV9HXN4_9PEZI|nr:cytochrome P450 [Cladorrhinum samala]
MASNATLFSPGPDNVVGPLAAGTFRSIPMTIGIALVLLVLINTLLTPRVDPREPPLLKPSIPFIGHIINLFRHQAAFHTLLSAESALPIATLQMLNGKVYAIWDPTLISAGLKSKNLSNVPQIRKYVSNLMRTSSEGTAFLTSPEGDDLSIRMLQHVIPKSLKGENNASMTRAALSELSSTFTSLSRPSGSGDTAAEKIQIPNLWAWTRHTLVTATSAALYGPASQDPFRLNPEMETALFDFEASLLLLSLGLPFPSVTAKVGHAARAVLSKGLEPFYVEKKYNHPACSAFVRDRAELLIGEGVPEQDIPRLEIMLPFAGMANTVPTLYWLLVRIITADRETVERLRSEVTEGLLQVRHDDSEAPDGGELKGKIAGGGGEAVLKIGANLVEEKCPLLWAFYRETLRSAVHQVSTRTVMQDTVLQGSGPGGGKEYLLKKGTVVQMAIGAGHARGEYWGEDRNEFRPERFLDAAGKEGGGVGSAKAVRSAYQPFGGGVHLCPGRFFAIAEMMAVVSSVLLAFDFEPLGGEKEWKIPKLGVGSLIDAVTKPADRDQGFGVTLKIKKGWKGVKWRYEMA